MKLQHKILSYLTVIGLLFGCAVFGTSCSPEYIAEMMEEYVVPPAAETLVHVIPDTEESTDGTEETTPVTLPGEDTLAPDCDHRYGEWCVAEEPQCEAEGLQYRICEDCNGREEAPIAPTGHTEVDTALIPPTCVLDGAENGTHCSVCQTVLTSPDTIAAKGHTFHACGICTVCGAFGDDVEGLDYLDMYNQDYGYEYLETMRKGSAMQRLYRAIDEEVRIFHTDPSMNASLEEEYYVVSKLDYQSLGLTMEEAQAVWKTYRDDNPLYYWISNMVACTSKKIYLLADSLHAVGTERIETNQVLYQNISGYLSRIPENATDYEIALLVHDGMMDAIDYALDSKGKPQTESWAHNVLGVFDGRGAVCEGFARAYQLLLNFKGVECLFVTGESREQGHAWNVVQLDGEWYGIDVTWDDGSEDTAPYAYFCLSDSAFYQSHKNDLPTDSGVDFLYGIPQLSQYSIEWVELYLDDTSLGRYTCIDSAFEAMTDTDGNYTVQLCDGKDDDMLHDTAEYHIYGDFPTVGELTLVGVHKITHSGFLTQTYTATEVYLTEDVTLSCNVTLKSLFLVSEQPVRVIQGQYRISEGDYSKIRNSISVE